MDISLCHHSVAYLFLSLQLHSWQGLSKHCFFLSSDRLKLFVEPCKVYFENYNYNLDSFKELRFQGPTWRLYPINCTQHSLVTANFSLIINPQKLSVEFIQMSCIKGIVSRDCWGLQMILWDRWEVLNISTSSFYFIFVGVFIVFFF